MNLFVSKIKDTDAGDLDILNESTNIKPPFDGFAGPTRLELATSCVTGRRSNQLNYDPMVFKFKQQILKIF